MLEIFLKSDSLSWVEVGAFDAGAKADTDATEAAMNRAEVFMVVLGVLGKLE